LAPAVSLHVVGKPGRRGQDVGGPVHPFPVFSPKDVHGSPMFPGNPDMPVPCSQTPAGPRRLAATALRCCPRYVDGEGSRKQLFRGSIARLQHALSTLRAAFTGDDARLASGGRLAFPGWD
jgi:hypothetical protein